MYSPPSSPSVLASTSRHNIIPPRSNANEQRRQKSLRLFLGDQSDEDTTSDNEYDLDRFDDGDSDADSGPSTSTFRLQAGPAAAALLCSPQRKTARARAYDDEEEGSRAPFFQRAQARNQKQAASPKKPSALGSTASKQQTANSAAIPTTPTKRQKGFVVRGNVTPSRAFSIFKAAKQRSQQRQQHGLPTPPNTSPLRPIILDSCDDSPRHVLASPSQHQQRHRGLFLSSSSPISASRSQLQVMESPSRSSLTATSRHTVPQYKPSAFSAGTGNARTLSNSLFSLRTRQGLHSGHGLLSNSRHFSAARTPIFDSTSYLETFVSPASCQFQNPRSADQEILSHPISAAYSYSSRSVNPSAQWLAVGDDEGRITLLNTLPWQDPAAECFAGNPQWQASTSAAIFEVVWRFDDRSLLSGASDFSIRSWDTEYQKCTAEFEGHGGSPRTIVYDPTTNGDGGCGMVFASAGRDGTIRIWDARTSSRGHTPGCDEDSDSVGVRPVLTINAAHATTWENHSMASKGRKHARSGAAVGARGKKRAQQSLPAGVTALSYLPDGQGHKLLSGGSANGIIKCWDLRHVGQSHGATPVARVDTASASLGKRGADLPADAPISAGWQTPDLSMLGPSPSVGLRSSHGLSQIVSSSTSLFASCTGGKIHALPLSTFLDSHLVASEVQTLYEPVQCQNTLFSRMALFDDRFLAVGCNTGNIALWDVRLDRTNQMCQPQRAAEKDLFEEREYAQCEELGFAHKSTHAGGMAVLTEGHQRNTEVNAVSWANGPNGPTLSSVGDDTFIRTWYPDRDLRHTIASAEATRD